MNDLIVEGATIIDGSGDDGFMGSVGIRGDRIAWIARGETPASVEAAVRLDAQDLVVTPGFVDVHNHSDLCPLVDPDMVSTIRQGVTTVVVGNCGSSPWPVAGAADCAAMAGGSPDAMDLRFASFGDYLDRIERAGPAVNIAALVGHGAVRLDAMGLERRPPTDDELTHMRRSVADAIQQGAVGLSTGLIYVPGLFSQTDEVVALAHAAAQGGGLYASHIRGEGAHLFRAVDEAIEIGRRAGLPAHVSHLKCESSVVWGRAEELLERFHGDADVTTDQYPYTAWSSVLWSLLPEWAPVADVGTLRADPGTHEQLVRAVEHGDETFQSSVNGVGWDRIVIEACGRGRWNGLSVQAIAEARSIQPVEACFDLLEEDPETSCIGHAMDEGDVRTIMADLEVMVASDAIAMSPQGPLGSLPVHPRAYGTFPRVLGPYVRDGLLGLEAAVRKMTSLPADRFGLRDRGHIAEGGYADLVVLDPSTVQDIADFGDPHAFPEGIGTVIVNGTVAWDAAHPTDPIGRSGRVLRSR
ncbi:MAG TPA: D-aminoacylase [Actinomycetota bacterium]